MQVVPDPIYKGSTRPPMKAGIPLVPLVIVFIVFAQLAIWSGFLFGMLPVLVLGMLFFVIALIMRAIAKEDDQRFRQIGLWLKFNLRFSNRAHWRTMTHSPTRFKKHWTLREKSVLSEVAQKEIPMAEYVPFRSHVSVYVIKGEGGSYMRVWRLEGIPFETADQADIATRHNAFNQFLMSLNAEKPGTAIWTHRVRRRISDRFKAQFPSEYAHELNERYFDSFSDYRMMANEQYLTIIYRPQRSKPGFARLWSRVNGRTVDDLQQEQQESIDYLDAVAHQVDAAFHAYGPEPLGVYEAQPENPHDTLAQPALCSSALEFFGFLLNGRWERVPLARSRINEYLPTSRLISGNENIEVWPIVGRDKSPRMYAQAIDFSDYAESSEPGKLNTLFYDNYECVETHSFSMLGKRDGQEALKLQKNQLLASEDSAENQVRQIDLQIEEIADGKIAIGEYHFSLTIFGDSVAEVTKNVQHARTALQDRGFQTKLVDLVPLAAWYAQLPGNWRYRPREAKLSSRAFCGLSSFHNFAAGKRLGNPWGEAVTILKTESGQPFYFNFHGTPDDEDSSDKKVLANTMIVGQSGAGKTALKMFLLSQATKFNPTGILFDKDRSEEMTIRALGGKYFHIRRGVETGFNPFKLEPTTKNVDFWTALIKKLVYHEAKPLTVKDEIDISNAVRTVASFSRELRSISTVRQQLPNDSLDGLAMRLDKWCAGHELGWAMDCPDDLQDFTTHKLYGYDYTEFLDDDEIRTPLMMYLMHLTESQIDGRRFMYGLAEFWKPLGDSVFEDFVKNKQKTIRKQNGFGIFDTQSPSDALESPISRTLIEQCATIIFLANPKAQEEDYIRGFKLTQREYDCIRELGEHSRMFLIKQGHRSAIAQLDLSGFDDDLDILSSSTDNVELLDQIRAELQSDEPTDWMPELRRRIKIRRSAGTRSFSSTSINAI